MSNEAIVKEQRPGPRFKVGQVVAVINSEPFCICQIEDLPNWSNGEWWYDFFPESNLRPLSADEIGGDVVADLSQRLTERDAMLAQTRHTQVLQTRELVEARDLCVDLLEALKDCHPCLDSNHERVRIGALVAEAELLAKEWK